MLGATAGTGFLRLGSVRSEVEAVQLGVSRFRGAGSGYIPFVTSLDDLVLPLIRTRSDLSRWGAANQNGRQMHGAVDRLEA
jgi:hypothetical protein